VSTVGTIGSANNVFGADTESQQMLNTQDFLKILITELTNQDPFEPMNNQDLLNQISSIQQLESTQNMTKTFTGVADKFDAFMGQLDGFLQRQQLSNATNMIGQFVSGTTESGQFSLGKVVGINLKGDNVLLELDTGEQIQLENMTRLGGTESNDIVGALVAGVNTENEDVVGIVESIVINNNSVVLQLKSGEELLLSSATLINSDTAHYLLDRYVEGPNEIKGNVTSYRINGEGVEGITLILDDGTELPLVDVTKIQSNSA